METKTGIAQRESQVESGSTHIEAVRKIDGRRVLVFASHPADEVFGCGGAIMRHLSANDMLRIIVVSDGATANEATLPISSDELRREESRRAAHIMGCGEPEFWGLPYLGAEYGERLIQRIVETIENSNADLVYAPSILEADIDSHVLAMSAVEAVRRHGGKLKLAMYELSAPMARPDTLLDISDLRARKQEAIACFSSCLGERPYDQLVAALNRFRTFGLPSSVVAAEAYFLTSGEEQDEDSLFMYGPDYARQRQQAVSVSSKDRDKVSVLVRSMDRPLLQDALDSLALQTYCNIEVVVIDAGGKGHRHVGAWCGRFPLRVISVGEALKRSRAANVGLDNAIGDYCLFLDDDDWLAPDHISRLVAAIRDDRLCRVAYAGVGVRSSDRKKMDVDPFNKEFSVGRLRSGNFIPIHAVLFARSLVNQGLRFDEAFDVYEDWDFLLQLAHASPFRHVNVVSAFYRASGTSGVGIHANEELQRQSRGRIFEKWRSRWSGAQIDEMVQASVGFGLQKQNQFEEVQQALTQARATLDSVSASLDKAHSTLEEKDRRLTQLAEGVTDLKSQLAERENRLAEQEGRLQVLNSRLYEMLHSTSWRAAAPIRWVGKVVLNVKRVARAVALRITSTLLGKKPWPQGTPFVSQGFAGETIGEPAPNPECPLISVVMPVYNACRTDKRFLLSAMESISNQTYPNVELVIVDDGSTDDTRQVCEDFIAAHPSLRTQFLSKVNGGQSAARNLGVKACNGEYVGFLDQDDEWYDDKLARVVPWLGNKKIDVIYTDSDSIDGTGQVTLGKIHRNHNCGWPHPKKAIEDILFKDIFVMPGLMTIKKEVFERVGGFDENLSGYEDDDLFLRLFENSNVFYLPISTLRWRIYGDNYSFSHRMLTSRTYYWKKLLNGYSANGLNRFRTHMISLRFFWQFMSQSAAQYQAGNDLCWKSLAGAKEIMSRIPMVQRVLFSFVFLLPDRLVLAMLARSGNFVRSS